MNTEKEMVNHPSHYNQGGIEVIDFTDSWKMDFCCGNAIKYICRSPYKGSELEDLKKAAWYINHKIELLEKESK